MNIPQFCKDAIAYASELGRLDFISALLAVLGIGLGLLAFVGYYSIKRRAEDIARETTEEMVNKIAAELIAEKLPAMLREHLKDKDNYNSNVADNIAETINEGEENG